MNAPLETPPHADVPRSEPRGVAGWLARASFVTGSAALLLAMLVDAVAVLGRHLGKPLLGSIELVQTCIVVAASSALVGATLGRAHASVHVLSERLPARPRRVLQRASDLLSALFFGALSAGSIWVSREMWGRSEVTELLEIPIEPLRVLWCASTLLIVALFVAAACSAARGGPHDA